MYVRTRDSLGAERPLGPTLAAELRVARGLLPGCVADLRRRLAPDVLRRLHDGLLPAGVSDPVEGTVAVPGDHDLRAALLRRGGLPSRRGRARTRPGLRGRFGGVAGRASCGAVGAAGGVRPELAEVVGILPPVPGRLPRPPRWVLAVAGGWRHPERIQVLEARAAFLGLRRAAMDRECENSILVSLGDNMGQCLAQDRERWRGAKCPIPSGGSVADCGRDFVEASACADRRECQGQNKPPRRRRPQAARQRDGLLARRTPPCPSPRRRSGKGAGWASGASPGRDVCRGQPSALEVSAGSGHLTGATLERGLAAAGVEVKDSPCFDVRWVAAGWVWWLHLAPP